MVRLAPFGGRFRVYGPVSCTTPIPPHGSSGWYDGPVTDTFGSIDLRGYNQGTANGGDISLGPFGIPFGSSGAVVPFSAETTSNGYPVPPGANGVCIIPPSGNTIGIALAAGSVAIYEESLAIHPQLPTLWTFDTLTPNVPGNVFLVSNGYPVLVSLQFT
jgi:hypothetical protein